MNVHQALEQGEAVSVGPVEIVQDWGVKKIKVPLRSLLVRDDSGQTVLKIWGTAANAAIEVGQIIKVQASGPKGSIKKDSYDGKDFLNCNDCKIVIDEEASESSAASTNTVKADLGAGDLLMSQAEYTDTAWQLAQAQDWPMEVKIAFASKAVENAALWWFGQKAPPSKH